MCDFILVCEIGLRPLIALNIPFEIAAKPLQVDTWLLLTAYKKYPPCYLPSPTLYDLPFTQNTAWLAYHSAWLPFKVIRALWFTSFTSF